MKAVVIHKHDGLDGIVRGRVHRLIAMPERREVLGKLMSAA